LFERMLELRVGNVRNCAHQVDSGRGETDRPKLLDLPMAPNRLSRKSAMQLCAGEESPLDRR
jgi:hypothetical protein